MNERVQTPRKAAMPWRLPAPGHLVTLQRKCACGGSGGPTGECTECRQKRLQRRATGEGPEVAPPIVHDVLRSPGQPLDTETRAYFEPRFGHDFSKVRVHTDAEASESAHAVNALAYTVGHHVVFAANRYNSGTPGGLRLLAHELTHVAQQEQSAISPWSPGIDSIPGGGQSVRVLPPIGESGDTLERAADSAADHVTKEPVERSHSPHLSSPALQRAALPKPLPICGAMVTDIDVLPPRPRGLVECGLPPTVMVTRVNIVGRQRTPASMGRGRIIFNLHVGYYRDPATNRLCAVISDSQRCLTPGGCIHLGCLPTLEEIVDAVLSFLKGLGIVLLAILAALLLRGLRFPVEDVPMEGPMGPPVFAGGPGQKQPGSLEG